MEGTKKWWESTGLWGVIVMVASMALNKYGYNITDVMQSEFIAWIVDVATQVSTIVGAVIAWRGRVKATKVIE